MLVKIEELFNLYRFFNSMAFLEAYFDESGTHKGSPIIFVAGALANKSSWMSIMRSWDRVLQKYSVPAFHATDLANFQGPYKGWTEDNRRPFISKLLGILEKEKLFYVGTGVECDLYHRIRADYPSMRLEPYNFCCELCIGAIIVKADKKKNINPISVTFESGQKFNSLALARLRKELKVERLREHYGISSISVADKKVIRTLEIADLIVYELYKHESNRILKLNRPDRYPLKTLLENTNHRCGMMDEEGIRIWLERLQESYGKNVIS